MTDWVRTAANRIERAGYRIEKSHISRLLQEPAPVYHCYAPGGHFLGVVGLDPARAQALCDAHSTQHEARP